MILSDSTIRRHVEDGVIGIEPSPEENQFQPASLDIRIGSELYDIDNDRTFEYEDEVVLHRGQPYLGHTVEEVSLPDHICAMMSGRSSVGRRGVVCHLTSGWIDPGFSGEITMEMYNFSRSAQKFDVGERVAQLVFMQLDDESSGYDGSYQDQTGPTQSVTEQ